MKFNKSIIAAALFMGAAGLASASTVYMTGSTALRGQTFTALSTAGTVFTAAPTTTLFNGGGSSANFMAFSGTAADGSGALTVQCHWSGSEAGIKDLATGGSSTFIDPSLLDGTDHGAAVPGTLTTQPVDVAMADNAQKFSRNKLPLLNTNTQVGVISFVWVRNDGLWTGTNANTLTPTNNVSSAQIIQALTGGVPRSVFDGDTNHTADYVYVSGRDSLSGTRVNAFGDSGYGILTPPNQVEVDSASANGDMKSDTDINGTAGVFFGDIGFSSGGTLAGTFSKSTKLGIDNANGGGAAIGYSVISYLSRGDANTATTGANKGVELSYNGVRQSRNAIIEGNYTLWGNAYVFQRQTPVASAQAQWLYRSLGPLGGISGAIGAPASGSAVKLTDMNCTRGGPNSIPAHN